MFLFSVSGYLPARLHMHQPDPKDVKMLFDAQLSASVSVCCYDNKSDSDITLEVDCFGTCDGRYLLTSIDGSAVVPLLLTLKGTNGTADRVMVPNMPVGPVRLNGNSCNNNTHSFSIVVDRSGINLAKFPYSARFQIIARDSKNKKQQRFFYITLNVEDFIRVSGLKDLVLQRENGWQGINERVCVFSTTGSYNLTATSGNSGNLANGLNRVPYVLSIQENGQWIQLLLGRPYTNITSSTTELCNDGKYIGVMVEVNENDMHNAPSGNYSDIVTLTVEAI